jgi:hypothetical protein
MAEQQLEQGAAVAAAAAEIVRIVLALPAAYGMIAKRQALELAMAQVKEACFPYHAG